MADHPEVSAPDVSIVVPSVNNWSDLHDCLAALAVQTGARVEMLVVDRRGPFMREMVRRHFPEATVLAMPPGATIPQMRARAIAAARAPAVAVIEDHVIVPPDWAARMLAALSEGHDVVAGSIENAATGRLMDWAAFLCEYSASLPPLPSGPAEGVPGNNVIYRKSVLDRYAAVLAEGKWENRLHDAMRADGIALIMRPEIVVGHKMHYTFWLYFSQRFLYSRSFAGARLDGTALPRRLAYGAAACALPPLLFWRTLRRILDKGRHRAELFRSLPLIALFTLSWGAGEAAGAWLGPGRALSRVR